MRNYIINYTYKDKKLFFIDNNKCRKRLNIKLIKIILDNHFDNIDFINSVYNLTSFCTNDIPFHSRLILIYLNINEIPKCPICGNNVKIDLKFTQLNCNIFKKTCINPVCAKTIAWRCAKISNTTIEKHKTSQLKIKANERLIIQNLKNIYETSSFNLKSKNEVKSYIKTLIDSRYKNGIILKMKHIINDVDYVASLLYYTSYIKSDLISYKTLNIGERLYALLNDITEYPKCKFCKCEITKFIDLKRGYIESCPDCAVDKNRVTLRLKTSNEIRNSINLDLYEILKFPKNVSKEHIELKCKKCNTIFSKSLINGRGQYIDHNSALCPNCKTGNSFEEDSLFKYIRSIYNGEISRHNRNIIDPFELDIVLHDINIAIEYDGLYWHSSDKVGHNYHLMKTNLCNSLGIRLIHIFEDEWNHKKDIVKSRLKHIISKSINRRIYARNCTISEINSDVKNAFLNKYHIQGSDISKFKYGLFYKNRLVAVMTFVKSRFNKNYEYELCRYATISNFTIVGGAGKLLKHFERTINPKSLISYADLRWSTGNVYNNIGFTLLKQSQPSYWYVKGDKRYSRVNFQKNKLSSKLEKFDSNLTEAENMKNNGYSKIYDCGNLVFTKIY